MVLSVTVGLLAYTLVDILLWQRIFEAGAMYEYDRPYHQGYAVLLAGLVAVGAVTLPWRWALGFSVAFVTLACSGLEDVLYYWLDGRAIPAALPWLDANPLIPFHPVTAWGLIASAAMWVGFWAAALAVLPKLRARLGARSWSA